MHRVQVLACKIHCWPLMVGKGHLQLAAHHEQVARAQRRTPLDIGIRVPAQHEVPSRAKGGRPCAPQISRACSFSLMHTYTSICGRSECAATVHAMLSLLVLTHVYTNMLRFARDGQFYQDARQKFCTPP